MEYLKMFCGQWSREIVTVALASLPLSELRGAIPYALSVNLPVQKAYWLAVGGNLLPVIPLLLFFGKGADFISKFRHGKRFLDWLLARTRSRSRLIRRFETLGLILFVAVPLPVTGAWTGTVAAFLFGIRFRPALISIAVGVMIAGLIVTMVSLGAISFLSFVLK